VVRGFIKVVQWRLTYMLLLVFIVMSRRDARGLHDYASKTRVVKSR